ncbi:RecX family transcriptional regulator [Bifidobacterium aemilianum]|uniref:Regulatory protein RecX n=1 Tax=Bifidobacterium aemilianum TaxID=2493120 RepID=A0A366K9A3_9BIFI|nr:RecX family transcriptional regulator [Bifidobacterium aemilianum]
MEAPATQRQRSSWGRPAKARSGRKGSSVGSCTPQSPKDPTDVDACREAGLRLLDASAKSSESLRSRLLAKGYEVDVVESVIHRLTELGLLDDLAYAQSVVRYCAARQMGKRGTVMELTRKGVARPLALQVAGEAEDSGVFVDAAWELGRRTARKTAGLDLQVRKRRFWSAGGRKGHDPAILNEIASALFTDGD